MIGGILILLVFAIFALLMYTRLVPALLAVPLMAVLMALVAGVPAAGIAGIVVDGSASLAPVYVAVIFGAMLGRVTLDTGIAKSIVNFAAEFGGERPMVIALVLSLVVAVLFVSLAGLGAIIMVGTIVLPIMMTTGVPRKIASTMFLMAFALGFIFNIANWKFYTKFFGVEQQQVVHYAVVLALVDLLALVVYAVVSFRSARGYATWAVRAAEPPVKGVPWWALVTPVLPIVLYFGLHVDPLIAFPLSAMYGVLTTRPRSAVQTLVASAIRGVEDVAPAVVLFIGIGMLLTATKTPQFLAALHPLVASEALRNPISFVILFGLLSPLTLFRGPLNPFGVGIAVFTALLAAHVFPPVILVAAIMAVVQVQNVCDPTNTANVWVANFTGVHLDEITKRTLPYQVAVATIAAILIVTAAPALLGAHPFAPIAAPARADEIEAGGMFVPQPSAYRIAVGNDGSEAAKTASEALVRGLAAWPGMRAFASAEDPNLADCSHKPYAAFVTANSTLFHITEGTDLDIGVVLSDCGGWEVSEWHDHQVFPSIPERGDIERLAAQGLARMDLWMQQNPVRAANLFSKGLAYAPGDPPTYYFSMFKTVDGQMRTFVRAGGPAYRAGFRTNDIVDKLDGRFWWEYGTFQTQLRAYDGKPHDFEIERGSSTLELRLGPSFNSDA